MNRYVMGELRKSDAQRVSATMHAGLYLVALFAAHPIFGDAVAFVAVIPVTLWAWRHGPAAGGLAVLSALALTLPVYEILGPMTLERLLHLTLCAAGLFPTAIAVGAIHLLILAQARRLVEMDHALAESEYRYRLAAPAETDGLWDWDLVEDEVYFSMRWAELLGLEHSEVSGRPAEWLDRVHARDRAPNSPCRRAVALGARVRHVPAWNRRSDGPDGGLAQRRHRAEGRVGSPPP